MTRIRMVGEPIDGGLRVYESERYFVDVLDMAFGNLRIVTTPKAAPDGYERGWCYRDVLPAVVVRALAFNPDAGEEPVGWVKEAGTERRACVGYVDGLREHRAYDPACPDCGGVTTVAVPA